MLALARRRRPASSGVDAERRRLLPLRHRRARAPRTATATATCPTRPTARPRASRGRPATPAPATCGRCSSGERAEQQLQTGDRTRRGRAAGRDGPSASGVGLVPEQELGGPGAARRRRSAPTPRPRRSASQPGEAAGSASPLTWAQAQYAAADPRRSRRAARVEQPAPSRDRYVDHAPPGRRCTVTAPADGSVRRGDHDRTSPARPRPGARVVVAATPPTPARPTVDRDRYRRHRRPFDVTVPTAVRHTCSPSTATTRRRHRLRPAHGGLATRPARRVLDVDRPGTATTTARARSPYPTSADFHAGAFDLERFQVIDARRHDLPAHHAARPHADVRDPLGAQLLTFFARDPAAPRRHRGALPEPQLHGRPVDAWPIRGAGFETPRSSTRAARRRARRRAGQPGDPHDHDPRAEGRVRARPAPGWTFNVVLHGQDGFGADQARARSRRRRDRSRSAAARPTRHRIALPGGARPAPEGDGRARARPGDRARPQPRPGRHPRRGGAVGGGHGPGHGPGVATGATQQ